MKMKKWNEKITVNSVAISARYSEVERSIYEEAGKCLRIHIVAFSPKEYGEQIEQLVKELWRWPSKSISTEN